MTEASAKVVHFELSLDDYNAMVMHLGAPPRSERVLWLAAIYIAGFGLVVSGRDGRVALAGMVAGFLLMFVKALIARRRLQPRPGRAVLCHYDVRLGESGAHVQTPNWTFDVPWRGIVAVEETGAHCFLRLDTVSAYTIPKRSFPDGEAAREFVDFARSRVASAASPKNSP